MRLYPDIQADVMALVRTQPLSPSRYIVKCLTERGHVSAQAVKSTLRALEFDGKIVNIGDGKGAWKVVAK
jgi:hypothetical protein